jgi:hypothetical protein
VEELQLSFKYFEDMTGRFRFSLPNEKLQVSKTFQVLNFRQRGEVSRLPYTIKESLCVRDVFDLKRFFKSVWETRFFWTTMKAGRVRDDGFYSEEESPQQQ